MPVTAVEIMPVDGQNLPFVQGLRDALALYARRTWPTNTSGHASRAWGLDKATVANLLKGHASDATLTKALRAGGWRLGAALLGAVIGQSLETHLDQELEAIRAERSRLDELEQAARLRWASLRVRDVRPPPGLRLVASEERHAGRQDGLGSGGVGD